MTSPRKKTGDAAENAACNYLQARGMSPLLRNHRCRFGEIDLIMDDKETLVFVEVRSRKNIRFGTAAESVNFHKQQRIIKTAQHFLMTHPNYHEVPCRFDVVTFQHTSYSHQEISWIKDAFQV